MDNRPIGVFDSGLGGLTAVKALRRLLPGEDLIYFGDTARVPYGGRSRETLLKYARQDIAFLRSFDLKAVLIACGTVTSTSLDTLRKENDLPVLGVVEPSCREALAVTKNKKIGMIATLASARSGAYERTLKGLDADVQVVSQPCPLFVPLVENGRFRQGDVVIETVAREYLDAADRSRRGYTDSGLHSLPLAERHHRGDLRPRRHPDRLRRGLGPGTAAAACSRGPAYGPAAGRNPLLCQRSAGGL